MGYTLKEMLRVLQLLHILPNDARVEYRPHMNRTESKYSNNNSTPYADERKEKKERERGRKAHTNRIELRAINTHVYSNEELDLKATQHLVQWSGKRARKNEKKRMKHKIKNLIWKSKWQAAKRKRNGAWNESERTENVSGEQQE